MNDTKTCIEDEDSDELEDIYFQPVLDDFITKNNFTKSFESIWERMIFSFMRNLDFTDNNITDSIKNIKIGWAMAKMVKHTIKQIKIMEKQRKAEEKAKIRSVISMHILLFNDPRQNSLLALNNKGERIRTEHRFATRRYIDKYMGKA